jgi:hypothetical protein
MAPSDRPSTSHHSGRRPNALLSLIEIAQVLCIESPKRMMYHLLKVHAESGRVRDEHESFLGCFVVQSAEYCTNSTNVIAIIASYLTLAF